MRREQLRKSRCFTSLLLPILSMLLAACAAIPLGDDDKGSGQQAFSTINKKSELMIGSNAAIGLELVKDVLKDKDKLRSRIFPYSDDPDDTTKKKLGPLIREVRKKNKDTQDGIKPFKGLGGGYYHTFLNAAELNIDPATDGYTNLEANPELWGRITDFEFTRKSNTDTGSGEMKVATIETYKLGDIIVGMNTFLWEIKINGNAYVIHKIQGGDDPLATWTDSDWAAWDPFPNTLFFSVDMKKRIHEKGFDVKLHARGNKINVTKLTVNGDVVTGSDKDYWPLTLPDKENCIDIFFALGDEDGDGQPDLDKIPTEYQQLTEHAYCLGRCEDPAIVNSR